MEYNGYSLDFMVTFEKYLYSSYSHPLHYYMDHLLHEIAVVQSQKMIVPTNLILVTFDAHTAEAADQTKQDKFKRSRDQKN